MKLLLQISLLSLLLIFSTACNEETKNDTAESEECATDNSEEGKDCAGCPSATSCSSAGEEGSAVTNSSAQITFVELGSVDCIPCKEMQPVMKSIEKNFGEQINIVFYDVRKEDQKKYAKKYEINLIPTQVFLDKDGKEIHRHEGFYAEKEIEAFLIKNGLKKIETKES